MQIYQTTNLINGKIYIGQDSLDRKYYLGSGNYIKRALEKHGQENFRKEVLEHCNSKEDLNKKEVFWIKKLNSKYPNGYNLSDGGEGVFNPPKETREKMSLAKIGIVPWNKGKTNVYSDETRRLMGYAQIGRPGWSKDKKRPEINGKNNPMYGKKRPDLAKYNKTIRVGTNHPLYGIGFMKGKKHSEETKNKISIATSGKNNPFYGRKHSLETRIKISKALKGNTPWNKKQ